MKDYLCVALCVGHFPADLNRTLMQFILITWVPTFSVFVTPSVVSCLGHWLQKLRPWHKNTPSYVFSPRLRTSLSFEEGLGDPNGCSGRHDTQEVPFDVDRCAGECRRVLRECVQYLIFRFSHF